MGWRLYATNAPVEKLPLSKAVNVFRGGPSIERNFARLKGRALGISPLYVQREDHACGMVRLLSLALGALTLVEHVVRKELKSAGETLSGLYAGNPKRQTARPTTERLLKAFRSIYLNVVHLPNQAIRHVTPLSALQERILVLLGIEPAIYEGLMPFVDTG
jgi:transposase